MSTTKGRAYDVNTCTLRVRWWQGQVRFQSIEHLLEERGYAKEDV